MPFWIALTGLLTIPMAVPVASLNERAVSIAATVQVTSVEICAADDEINLLKLSVQYRFTSLSERPLIFGRGEPLVYYYRYADSESQLATASWNHIGWVAAEGQAAYGARPNERWFVIIKARDDYSVRGTPTLLVQRRDFPPAAVLQLVVAPLDFSEDLTTRLSHRWNRYGDLYAGGVKTAPFGVKLADSAVAPCKDRG